MFKKILLIFSIGILMVFSPIVVVSCTLCNETPIIELENDSMVIYGGSGTRESVNFVIKDYDKNNLDVLIKESEESEKILIDNIEVIESNKDLFVSFDIIVKTLVFPTSTKIQIDYNKAETKYITLSLNGAFFPKVIALNSNKISIKTKKEKIGVLIIPGFDIANGELNVASSNSSIAVFKSVFISTQWFLEVTPLKIGTTNLVLTYKAKGIIKPEPYKTEFVVTE